MVQSLSPNLKEWSKEQREVWRCLEDHWKLLTKGKIKEFLEYIHPEFRGFGHESPLMLDKRWLTEWVGFWSQTTTFPIHYISPISCWVQGEIAILQYIIFTIEKSAAGTGRSARRYTMTWLKTKSRWQIIASHNNKGDEAAK